MRNAAASAAEQSVETLPVWTVLAWEFPLSWSSGYNSMHLCTGGGGADELCRVLADTWVAGMFDFQPLTGR